MQTKNGQLRACGITVMGDQMMNGSRGKRKLSDGSYAEGVAKLSRGQYPNDFQQQQQFAQYSGYGVEGERGFGRQGFDPYAGAYYGAGTPTGQQAQDYVQGYPSPGGAQYYY